MTQRRQWRKIYCGICNSNKIRSIPKQLRLFSMSLYVFMIPWADDEGRLRGDLKFIDANILTLFNFPHKEIEKALNELVNVKLIQRYGFNGEMIIQICDWNEYNKVAPLKYLPSIYKSFDYVLSLSTIDGTIGGTIGSTVATEVEVEVEVEKDLCATDVARADYFSDWWSLYPRKRSKLKAEIAFKKLNLDEDLFKKMMVALYEQSHTYNWTKEDGEYVPYPTTWLSGRRWEDELDADGKKPPCVVD